MKALHAGIAREPMDFAALWLGRCFYQLGDYNRAISSLERAIGIDPERLGVSRLAGQGLWAQGGGDPITLFRPFAGAQGAPRIRDAVRLDPPIWRRSAT